MDLILNLMQAELVAHHFPTDEVKALRNEYEKAKSERHPNSWISR